MRFGSLFSPSFTSSVAEGSRVTWFLLIHERKQPPPRQRTIILPAPTAWPIVLAFGITLLFAGLVTSASRQHSRRDPGRDRVCRLVSRCPPAGEGGDDSKSQRKYHSSLPLPGAKSKGSPVAPDLPRALLPLETYPVSAGIKGGLAGSVAMAVLACLYGLLKQGSIWYPINLLAATVYSQSLQFGTASLNAFPSG